MIWIIILKQVWCLYLKPCLRNLCAQNDIIQNRRWNGNATKYWQFFRKSSYISFTKIYIPANFQELLDKNFGKSHLQVQPCLIGLLSFRSTKITFRSFLVHKITHYHICEWVRSWYSGGNRFIFWSNRSSLCSMKKLKIARPSVLIGPIKNVISHWNNDYGMGLNEDNEDFQQK